VMDLTWLSPVLATISLLLIVVAMLLNVER
jgi:hypothetical protein